MPANTDRVDQLSEAAHHTASKLESLSAALVGLRGRLDSVEAQVESLRAAQGRTAEAVESVRSQLVRIDHAEGAVTQLGGELSRRIEEVERTVRVEIDTVRKRQGEQDQALAREHAKTAARVTPLEELPARITSLARERGELARELGQVVARLEEVAAERPVLSEETRRVEQRISARAEGLQAELVTAQEEIVTWRARIEGQEETLRQARFVVDEMRAAADDIAQAHHATREAERLFEGRVEALLAELRIEAAQAWQRFHQERGHDWVALAKADAERDRRLAALDDVLVALQGRLEGLDGNLATGLVAGEEALSELRREVGGALGALREAVSSAVGGFEASLAPEDQPALQAARREASRRALRARRDAREH